LIGIPNGFWLPMLHDTIAKTLLIVGSPFAQQRTLNHQ